MNSGRELLRLHGKQLLIAIVVAFAGLGFGTLVSAKILPARVTPSPSPKTVAQKIADDPTPTPTVSSSTPAPAVSAKPTVTANKAPAAAKSSTATGARQGFHWGITLRAYPFREKNDEFLPEQFRQVKELGLTDVRIDYDPKNQPMNDLAVKLAKENGLNLIFVIPFGPNDIFSDGNLYQNSYDYVAAIVNKYKNDIDIWQLANEVASVALVDGNHHGADKVDYPAAKYKAVSTWLKAATKAVKDNDATAKRLINDQWIHTGFFDMITADKIEFEILGWNWFSDMGTNMEKVVIDSKTKQSYALLAKLKSYKKEIWLTEVNRRLGSTGGKEKDQADFIQYMAEASYKNTAVGGYLVYLMLDDQTASAQESGYSLIKANPDTQQVTGVKEAFNRYRDLVKAKPR